MQVEDVCSCEWVCRDKGSVSSFTIPALFMIPLFTQIPKCFFFICLRGINFFIEQEKTNGKNSERATFSQHLSSLPATQSTLHYIPYSPVYICTLMARTLPHVDLKKRRQRHQFFNQLPYELFLISHSLKFLRTSALNIILTQAAVSKENKESTVKTKQRLQIQIMKNITQEVENKTTNHLFRGGFYQP